MMLNPPLSSLPLASGPGAAELTLPQLALVLLRPLFATLASLLELTSLSPFVQLNSIALSGAILVCATGTAQASLPPPLSTKAASYLMDPANCAKCYKRKAGAGPSGTRHNTQQVKALALLKA